MKNTLPLSFSIRFCIVAFLFGALAPFSLQGFPDSPDALFKYLPETAILNPWETDGPPKPFKGNELYNYIDGDAEIFHEYGFHQMIAQRYTLGDNSITVDIYEMNHPRAAYGIYSAKRDSDMPALEIGDDGTDSNTVVRFVQERYYVVAASDKPAEDARQALIRFARAVSRKINKSSPLPDLLEMLPAAHRIPGSSGYISGILGLNAQFYLDDSNVLGIDGRTVECVFGRYKIREEQANLLVIRYPDSSAAKTALNKALEVFARKYNPVSVEDIPISRDRRNRFYHIAAGNRFLYIISRSDSIELTRELASLINSSIK